MSFRSWFFYALLTCLLLTVLLAAFEGTLGPKFTKMVLADRLGWDSSFAWHRINETTGDTNPVFGQYCESYKYGFARFTEFLVWLGLSFQTAAIICILLVRTGWGLGLAFLAYGATQRAGPSLMVGALAYGMVNVTSLYSSGPFFHHSGTLVSSLFMMSVVLLWMNRWAWAMLLWALQLWIHPTTSVTWSPLLLALVIAGRNGFTLPSKKWTRLITMVLIAAPPLVGFLAGLAEYAGLLPFQAGEQYWALLRVRSIHSVFFSTVYANKPWDYLSVLGALFFAGWFVRQQPTWLRTTNLLFSAFGLGIALLWITCTETEWSCLAAMSLPLRFQVPMYFLILANLFHAIFNSEQEEPWPRLWAFLFLSWIVFPIVTNPLAWIWSWALGQAWITRRDDKDAKTPILITTGLFLAAMLLYLIFMPSSVNFNRHANQVYLMMTPLPWLVLSFAFLFHLRLPRPKKVLGVLLALLALTAFYRHTPILKPDSRQLRTFFQSFRGIPEHTEHKKAVDWINSHLPRGASTLVHPYLYLHMVTPLKVSTNHDLTGFFIYTPSNAGLISDEIKKIYNQDVLELASQGKGLSLKGEDWHRVRERVLGNHPNEPGDYSYVIEPAQVKPSVFPKIIFSNDYLRIYKVRKGRS